MDYEDPQAVQSELQTLLPGYYNLGEPRPAVAKPQEYFQTGYVEPVAARYRSDAEKPPPEKPFALVMGKVLYHSGKLSTRASGLTE